MNGEYKKPEGSGKYGAIMLRRMEGKVWHDYAGNFAVFELDVEREESSAG